MNQKAKAVSSVPNTVVVFVLWSLNPFSAVFLWGFFGNNTQTNLATCLINDLITSYCLVCVSSVVSKQNFLTIIKLYV